MAKQNPTLTQEESDFQSKWDTDSDEILRFDEISETDPTNVTNPRYRLAPEYFRIYLETRPSKLATRALRHALNMWWVVQGVSDEVQEAIKQISHEEDYEKDVWNDVEHCVFSTLSEEDWPEEGLALMEELMEKVTPLRSKSILLFKVAQWWHYKGEIQKARRGYEQILTWDASQWHVDRAPGLIHECDNLHIGQIAPRFSARDIDGNLVDLDDQIGKVVILDFWSTDCPFCYDEFPHLRRLSEKFGEDRLTLIGIALDKDFKQLQQTMEQEQITWPQICEGNGWEDPLAKLFNIWSLPNIYILDKDSRIAFKQKRGEEIEQAVASLVV